MDLEDLDPQAELLDHEIVHALRRLDAATHVTSEKRVAAVLEAIDTCSRVRRILSWAKLDPAHKADVLARLRRLSDRIRALSTGPHKEP